jgi:hypothetical protein
MGGWVDVCVVVVVGGGEGGSGGRRAAGGGQIQLSFESVLNFA